MTILVQQQLREATERLIAEGENCWPATVERFTELANPATVLALLDEIDRLERHKLALDDLLESYQVAQREVADLEEKCQLLALHGELAAADADWASDDGKEAAKERDRLKAENAELIDLMRRVVAEHPRRSHKNDGNGPGHSHAIPGVWDEDNGELAGKPCAWCSIWNAAKGIVERHEQAMSKEQQP